MAYHDLKVNGQQVNLNQVPLETLQKSPPGALAHEDIGVTNVVLAALTSGAGDSEHTISPVLQLIDFGTAKARDPTE